MLGLSGLTRVGARDLREAALRSHKNPGAGLGGWRCTIIQEAQYRPTGALNQNNAKHIALMMSGDCTMSGP